ncbi:hypothetical protein D3C87_1205070 [compost metagenome]
MRLLVFGQVDRDQRPLAAEHQVGQRPRRLRLADPRRPDEQEHADRCVFGLEPRLRRPQPLAERFERLVLAHHHAAQPGLQIQQRDQFAGQQAVRRHPGPVRDDFGDRVLVHLGANQRLPPG